MVKQIHEIRDPIHVFIKLNSDERKVLDSRPFQRLRYIHQLALTYLVYPGATHKRFEHSLGVMELATRVYDVVTNPVNVNDIIKDVLPQICNNDEISYWRHVIRMAALCHDMGHLPFSHAAEKELLPEGWNHEKITKEIILSDDMKSIWNNIIPPLKPDHIVKLALGPKQAPNMEFNDWETILSEIIVGNAFGVDRIDYLLRDSYHTGVAYGKFDHYRLIDTLRILPPPPPDDNKGSKEPMLGVEEGGLQSAEALLLARYFMFSQVYFHPVRRIYDIHLKDFLLDWLKNGKISIKLNNHLSLTDNEVISALYKSCNRKTSRGYEHAKRIIERKHFKVLYQRNPDDIIINPEASQKIFDSVKKKFGVDNVRFDECMQEGEAPDFPVLTRDNRIVSSLALSQTLRHLPIIKVDYVFVNPVMREKSKLWIEKNRNRIIKLQTEIDFENN